MNAFLTGSRRYGIPREDSDYDLVLLVDEVTFEILEKEFNRNPDYPANGLNIKEGNLNLIVEKDTERFNMWVEGTKQLAEIGSITKEQATNKFKRLGL